MRFLLDESAGRDLEHLLPEHGIEAAHAETLQLAGSGDPLLLELARRDYDAIVTKDRYRKGDARAAALRGMLAGLRIIELRFTGRGPEAQIGTSAEQLELILGNLERIEDLIQPDSRLRKLVLNGSTGTVTRVMHVDDVAAEIARLGL